MTTQRRSHPKRKVLSDHVSGSIFKKQLPGLTPGTFETVSSSETSRESVLSQLSPPVFLTPTSPLATLSPTGITPVLDLSDKNPLTSPWASSSYLLDCLEIDRRQPQTNFQTGISPASPRLASPSYISSPETSGSEDSPIINLSDAETTVSRDSSINLNFNLPLTSHSAMLPPLPKILSRDRSKKQLASSTNSTCVVSRASTSSSLVTSTVRTEPVIARGDSQASFSMELTKFLDKTSPSAKVLSVTPSNAQVEIKRSSKTPSKLKAHLPDSYVQVDYPHGFAISNPFSVAPESKDKTQPELSQMEEKIDSFGKFSYSTKCMQQSITESYSKIFNKIMQDLLTEQEKKELLFFLAQCAKSLSKETLKLPEIMGTMTPAASSIMSEIHSFDTLSTVARAMEKEDKDRYFTLMGLIMSCTSITQDHQKNLLYRLGQAAFNKPPLEQAVVFGSQSLSR